MKTVNLVENKKEVCKEGHDFKKEFREEYGSMQYFYRECRDCGSPYESEPFERGQYTGDNEPNIRYPKNYERVVMPFRPIIRTNGHASIL